MLQLAVGDTLLLTCADLGDRLVGVLTDMRENEFLLVQVCLPDKTRSRLRKNPAVTVQFAFESTLLGFHTRLTQPPGPPDFLLSLAWPAQVANMDPREERRLPCLFQGRLRPDNGDDRAAGADCLVEDLSPSALRVRLLGAQGEETWTALDADQACELAIAALDPGQARLVRCSVLKTFRKDSRPYAILHLAQDDQEARGLIRDYMDRVLDKPA